jgi:hypothetical protein
MRRTGSFVVRLVSIALVGAGAVAAVPSSSSAAGGLRQSVGNPVASPVTVRSEANAFAPLQPGRLLDTRPTGATIDSLSAGAGSVAARGVVEVRVIGRANVPASGVSAVVLNVTAIGEDEGGYVTVFPTGSPQPTASNINYEPGQPTANLVVAPVGQDGKVSIFVSSKAHVIADVQGWFSQDPGFTSLQPARLLDTRSGAPTVDGVSSSGGAVAADGTVSVKVIARGSVPVSGAKAVVLNVTAIGEDDGGYVTVFPSTTTQPTASNINYQAGQPRANLVVAPVGPDGQVSIFVSSKAHVIADVQGWFSQDPGFTSLQPARLLDTRAGAETVDGAQSGRGALNADGVIELPVVARGSVPATGAGAVVLNVTAIGETDGGFVTVFPAGSPQPNVSNINYPAGQPTANLVVAPISNGKVSLFVSSRAHLIVDVQGWFPVGAFVPPTEPTPPPPPLPTGTGDGTITVNAASLRPFSSRMFGTNASSFEGRASFSDPQIIERVNGMVGSMRWPGGQHSQFTGWANCLLGSLPTPTSVANAAPCITPNDQDPTGSRGVADYANASDFIKLMKATNTTDAVIGMNMSVTAKENTALVAFFNGAVGDTRSIGVDQKGADWKTVGYWAGIRQALGNPDPLNLTIFEFGNETYGGGSQGGKKGCFPPSPGAPGGWEPTYTCDPAEYLDGLGTGAARFDGFKATRNLMKSLFPSVLLGAPIADTVHDKAVSPDSGWNTIYLPYAQQMVALGKNDIDFLNVHEYITNKASIYAGSTDPEIMAAPQIHWKAVVDRLNGVMDTFAGKRLPMYQSEYALYPVVSNDDKKRTNTVFGGLVMADSIGQMDALGFIGASQFNMYSSQDGNLRNIYYGLLRNDGQYTRSPNYWGTLLWSRFGNKVAATTSTFDNKTSLSVYGGKTADGQISVLVINKTTSVLSANINFQGVSGVNRVVTDVASSETLQDWTMSFNGKGNPAGNLSNAPSADLKFAPTSTALRSFPPGSITLLRFTPTA